MSSWGPLVYPPAAPPSALPRVELMMSTLPLKPRNSSVPLLRRKEGGRGEREREREREREGEKGERGEREREREREKGERGGEKI